MGRSVELRQLLVPRLSENLAQVVVRLLCPHHDRAALAIGAAPSRQQFTALHRGTYINKRSSSTGALASTASSAATTAKSQVAWRTAYDSLKMVFERSTAQ